jgi:hypothetical protein
LGRRENVLLQYPRYYKPTDILCPCERQSGWSFSKAVIECLLITYTEALFGRRFAPIVAFTQYYVRTERRAAKRRPNQQADV